MSTSRFGGVDVDSIERNPCFWSSCFYSSTRYPLALSKSIPSLGLGGDALAGSGGEDQSETAPIDASSSPPAALLDTDTAGLLSC